MNLNDDNRPGGPGPGQPIDDLFAALEAGDVDGVLDAVAAVDPEARATIYHAPAVHPAEGRLEALRHNPRPGPPGVGL